MRLRLVALLGLSASLLGCSINPLPDDISRLSTYDIVHKIKCEARQGLIDFPYKFPPEHVVASYEGAAPPAAAPPPGRPHFPDPEFLRLTAIGFYFQFDVTEKNNAQSGKLDFLNPFGGGSFQLTLTGKAEKKRQNVRTFVVVEYLDDLMKSQGCDGENLRTNPIYPITGSIGANETVETFLRLERKLKEGGGNRDKSGLFSDELEFTTTFGAGAQPTLKLNAGAANFRLREVSLNANAERTDIHKVAMALATRESRPRAAARGAVILESTGRLRSVGPTIIQSPDPKDLVLQELYRLRSLDDDARVFNRGDIIVP